MWKTTALVFALATSTASAGPYMTGIGLTNIDLFPNGLFPDCSGPVLVGGGATAKGDPVLRFGAALLKYRDVDSLASPQWIATLESLVYLGADPYFTMGFGIQRGLWRVLVGASTAFAIRETPASGDSDYALLVAPEVSLPLRWRAHPRFTPSAVLFARLEVPLTGRDSFGDQVVGGVSLAMW